MIEIHQAQDLLKFTGDERDKCLKVLEVHNQLKKNEDRVPFFLCELLKSGESSATNQTLYDKLSDEMDFTDVDVSNACKNSSNAVSSCKGSMISVSLMLASYHYVELEYDYVKADASLQVHVCSANCTCRDDNFKATIINSFIACVLDIYSYKVLT